MNNNSVKVKNVNKLIFVDKLEISFSGIIPIQTTSTTPDTNGNKKKYIYNQHCYIEYQPHGNKLFENIADLWIRNRKIGEFRFNPRQHFIDSELLIFKYDNVQLYQNNYLEYVDLIVTDLGLKYCNIHHIDIAVDCITYGILKFVHKYIERTRSDKTYSIHHKGKITRENITRRGDDIIHWGNINSDKYIKIYNKTEELNNPNNYKNYIPVSCG